MKETKTRSGFIGAIWAWSPALLAVAVYLGFCWTLAIGTAGLQYDEAISFRGAAALVDGQQTCWSEGRLQLTDHLCLPLMVAPYVGSPKDYFLLPALAIAGVRTGVARMGAAVLSALCIVGVWLFLRELWGGKAAAIGAIALALHPSYINLPLFDNGNVAFSFAVAGLLMAVAAALVRGVSRSRVFWFGFLAGLGVWSRLNFAWLLASAGVAILVVYRRDVLRALRHAPMFAAGAVVGGLPLIAYLSRHLKDLLAFVDSAGVDRGLANNLNYFMLLFPDVLFSSREHRTMWGAGPAPAWEGRVALIVIAAALVWCAAVVKTRAVRALSIGNILLALFYAFSKLPVAEHHLVFLAPFEIMLVALACADLLDRYRLAWVGVTVVAVVYCFGALASNIEAAEELHKTRGIGEWSAGIYSLVGVLGQHPQPLYELDWGLAEPLHVLSGGRLKGTELFFGATARLASDGRNWVDIAKGGGTFVTYDIRFLHFPQATLSFRRALSCMHRSYRRLMVSDRSGAPYATVYILEPEPGVAADQADEACANGSGETFLADPNPILVRDGSGIGETTLVLNTTRSKYVEIHVDKPDGPLFSRFSATADGTSGTATTGKWVTDGMKFYLQDVSGGKALSAENTLASVTVQVNGAPSGH